jgi:uncharacterized repeat protein (TIGR03803 family)
MKASSRAALPICALAGAVVTPLAVAGMLFAIVPSCQAEGVEPGAADYEVMVQMTQENSRPYGRLTLAPDGMLYGFATGYIGDPVFFRVSTDGEFTVLRRFDTAGDPKGFQERTLGPDGDFYGTGQRGGAHNLGALYRLSRQGELTILHSFKAPDDGGCWYPGGRLLKASDGDFYGTASYGGAFRSGCTFRMTPSGKVTVLHEFGAPFTPNDGITPLEALTNASDGLLYGVTYNGGRHGGGTVFRMNRHGFSQTLHSFHHKPASPDGFRPNTALAEGPDGLFYGTTSGDDGVIYRIGHDRQWAQVHAFSHATTYGPRGDLWMRPDGTFWGTTVYGAAGHGVIYQVTPAGQFSVLHEFAPGEGSGTDGVVEVGANELWGVTQAGGPSDWGTIYRLRLKQ